MKASPGAPLIETSDLRVSFTAAERNVHALNGVDLVLNDGEILGILGESGSGKSVTLRALMRLLPERSVEIAGRISVAGQDLMALDEERLRALRGRTIAMVFQEPMTALDPVYSIGHQLAEPIVQHDGTSWRAARARALDLLDMVQIPSAKRRLDAYPHELSGGLRQRAMIAIALSCRPRILLADEPTTALDATVQIQILLLLRRLQRELGMAVIFVTHDMGVAAEIADRLAVMYAGRVIETGPVGAVMRAPLHPYTEALLGSTIRGNMRGQTLRLLKGSPPDMAFLPPGCSFAPRCGFAAARCQVEEPGPHAAGAQRMARCLRLDEIASLRAAHEA